MYTQLAATKRLLYDLLEDRRHGLPCNCGACVYGVYLEKNKAEGRRYSKRTFFVYSLRSDFSWATFYEWNVLSSQIPRLPGGRDLFWEARERRKDARNGKKSKKEQRILSIDIYVDELKERLKSIPKKKTLGLIKKLAKEEKNEKARAFLQSILNKKSFYTYYRRAGEPALFKVVSEIRLDLLKAGHPGKK